MHVEIRFTFVLSPGVAGKGIRVNSVKYVYNYNLISVFILCIIVVMMSQLRLKKKLRIFCVIFLKTSLFYNFYNV